MGKKKQFLSDNTRKKKMEPRKNTGKNYSKNPFEVHFNKQKHQILGRKTKHDKGLPGMSRLKAINKRKETLLIEYKDRNKTNSFKDQRFGEKDISISFEDKMLERFAIQQKSKHKSLGKFNLTGDEELTHLGQSLSDFPSKTLDSNFPMGDENSDELGGLFVKKGKANEIDDDVNQKNKQDVMDEIIIKSKKGKYEMQAATEQTNELTEKLDTDWSALKSLLQPTFRTPEDKIKKPAQNNYDLVVKEMIYDRKSVPSFPAKSELAIQEERKKMYAKLHNEMIERMNPPKALPRHQSADELCRSHGTDKIANDSPAVAYDKDGKMIPLDEKAQYKDEEFELLPDVEEAENSDDNETDDDESDSSDGYSDIGDDADSNEFQNLENQKTVNGHRIGVKKSRPLLNEKIITNKDIDSLINIMLQCDSPYISESVNELLSLVKVSKVTGLPCKIFKVLWNFTYQLALINKVGDIDKLVESLYDLATMDKLDCAKYVQVRLDLMYNKATKLPFMPSTGNIIELKLIKLLWCTSDFKHPVVTSALVYMGHALYILKAKSLKQLSSLLLLCTLMYDYVSFTRRYVPEVITCLTAVLYTALPKPLVKKLKRKNLMLMHAKNYSNELLTVDEISLNLVEPIDIFNVCNNSEDVVNDEVKSKIILTALKLVSKFVKLYMDMTMFKEMFTSLHSILILLQKLNWNSETLDQLLSTNIKDIEDGIENTKIEHLTLLSSKRPKMIKLLEPAFEDNVGEPFRKGSNKVTSRTQKDHDRLAHKYKREIKGAVREIRKDTKFLASEKLKEQLANDEERRNKVKRLYGLLANQEGDVKKIQRKKFKLELG